MFALGFVMGVYVGTYYNCKPIIECARTYIAQNIPSRNNKPDEKLK